MYIFQLPLPLLPPPLFSTPSLELFCSWSQLTPIETITPHSLFEAATSAAAAEVDLRGSIIYTHHYITQPVEYCSRHRAYITACFYYQDHLFVNIIYTLYLGGGGNSTWDVCTHKDFHSYHKSIFPWAFRYGGRFLEYTFIKSVIFLIKRVLFFISFS